MLDQENSQTTGQQETTTDESVSAQDAGSGTTQNDSPTTGDTAGVSTPVEPSAVSQSPSELEDLKQKYTGASTKLYEQKVAYRKLQAEAEQLRQTLAKQKQQQQQSSGQQTPWYQNPEAAQWDLPTIGQNMDEHVNRIVEARLESAIEGMIQKENERQQLESQAQTMTRVENTLAEMQQQYNLTPQEIGDLIAMAQEDPSEFLKAAITAKYSDRIQKAQVQQTEQKVQQSVVQKLAANARQVVQSAQGSVPTKKPVDNRPWWERMKENIEARNAA
jgi:hypothetical protein